MKEFRPAWWLPGPHAVTLWGKFGRREPELPMRWETLDTPDGDFLELVHVDAVSGSNVGSAAGSDIAAAAGSESAAPPDSNAERPRLLILHGLEGGVNSHYVRGLMREAHTRGWHSTLMLYRTCGPTPNALPRSYHSGETGDPLLVMRTLIARQPNAPLGVVGVSLGGNILCKLLGEGGDDLPSELKAAVAVSAPFDLARGSRRISRGFSQVYERSFLRSLVPKAHRKIGRHPELERITLAQRIRTIWQFDDEFTSQVHGFASAADYYTRSSSLQFLAGIRRPTLLLNAVDDPFLPPSVLEDVRTATANNPAITIEFPERGGHVGFVAGASPWRPFYYGEWRAAQFVAAHFASAR